MSQTSGAGIVGRDEPLHRIDDLLAASAEGRRSALFVGGEAGMGKTSLLREAFDASRTDTIAVGWGTCWHGEGAPGFWPWMQAFDDLVRTVGLHAAVTAAGHDRDRLSLLARGVGSVVETADDPDRDRLLLLDAAVRWLDTLAIDHHVVLVLDDLQWADSSTLDLLDFVVSAPAPSRLLVVGAYRHDELDHDNRARLAALGAQTHQLQLEGLDVDAVEALAGTICGPAAARETAEDLHRRTGGHPMFVRELATFAGTDRTGPLPTAVTAAVARRLASLPPESRRLLEVASVLGNRLLPDVLALATDGSSGAVVDRLESTIATGLVRSGPSDDLWFTHDVFRETLYAGLDPTERSRLHARVGDALEGRRARGSAVAAGDLARHFTCAMGSVEPSRAIHWATEAAADERRRLAFTEAAGHLRRAREAAADAGWTIEPSVLVRLLMDEAENQARSGDPDRARDVLTQAGDVAAGPADQADVALAVQRLGAKFSAPRDAIIERLESALRAVAGVDLIKEAQVTAALARELQHSVAEDRDRALPLSERAVALGRNSDHDPTIVACLLARHDALWIPGTGSERAALGREIAEVGARLGHVDRTAEGMLLEANGLLESGSAVFRSVLDRWFGLLEGRDEPRDRYLVGTRRAALALLEGDADRAEALMEDSARIGEQIREPDTGNVLMSQRVALAGVRNDPDELRVLAIDAVRWWTGAPVLAHAVAAGACAKAGDLDGAATQVAIVSESGGWRAEGSYLRSVLVMHLAEAATALDDLDLCRSLLDDIDDLSSSCGVNGAVVAFAGPFAHTAGILAGTLDERRHADAMLRRSIETARRLGAAVWVREGVAARRTLDRRAGWKDQGAGALGAIAASLVRADKVWHVTWQDERASLSHTKGLTDIAALVRRPGQEVAALELAGGTLLAGQSTSALIDLDALRAYRDRLDEIDDEIERAGEYADSGRVSLLGDEREQILGEIRRATGLGGRLRPNANDPSERARKAVSARMRDAIRRLDAVAPQLAAHLDRSIHTGLRCVYRPTSGDTVRWHVSDPHPQAGQSTRSGPRFR